MRIVRYAIGSETAGFGVLGDDAVTPVAPHPFGPFTPAGDAVPLDRVRLLAPVLPSKIVAVGKNYAEHAREMSSEVPDDPVIFLKPSTSVIGPGDPIVLPSGVGRVDFEGELAVVIGRLARRLEPATALAAVLGYTCANDVTARDLQQSDGQWTRAKGFDSFCPLGPWIETELDPADLGLRTIAAGAVRQDGRTSDMARDTAAILTFITSVMTLLPGDVVLTGTPAGVGPLESGTRVDVEIEGIGTLSNPVVGEPVSGGAARDGRRGTQRRPRKE